ncbi:MAG: TMEM175 family protein, partial [Chloroflexota bacterium]
RHRSAVNRLESLTDVVFALSVIVLVLRTELPRLDVPPPELPAALIESMAGFYVYPLCFLFLFVYWVLHHYQFRYLTRSSGRLVWLTGLLIASVAVLPLTASLLGSCGLLTATVLIFEVNVLVIHLLLYFTWKHAVKGGLMFGGDVPSGIVRRMRTALRLGVTCILITVGLAFVAPNVSISVLVGLALFYIVLTARGGYTLDVLHQGSPSRE